MNRKPMVILGVIAALLCFAGAGLLAMSLGSCQAMGEEFPWGEEDQRHTGDYLEATATPTHTVFLPVVSGSQDASYYVSADGNDENDGRSREAAFRTIERALEVVQPGEAILILSGVYNEALTLENVGSSDQPIVIQGEGSGTILDGQRTSDIGFWCEGCNGFIIGSLEFRNYTDVGIGCYASSDITMQNLTVHNNGFAVQLVSWEFEGYGIHVDESQRIVIEDSDVYENGPQPRPFGTLGTGINTYGCTNCVIRNNDSHDNIGGGILVEDGVNVLVEGNEVVANYLDATEDEWWDGGIWVDGGHHITVTNNTFQDNIGPGIQISDEDDQDPYAYVLEGNTSTANTYGIYIWNFGSTGFPPENILRMTDNQITGNTVQDVWIIP